MAATSASAAPMFTTTISDGGDGTANFEVSNGSDAGEMIDSVTFSLGSDEDLTFEGISNPGGSAVSNSTNSGDNELMIGFDAFATGQNYTFSSVISEDDDDSVDSATDALFGNLGLSIMSGGEAFSTTVTAAETTLPGGDMSGGDDGDDSDNGDNGDGGGNGVADVPEPGTLGLMGLGLVGLASTYRRRKS
jgi:hypothetical protein